MFDYFTLSNFVKFMKILLDVSVVWAAFYFVLKIVKNNTRTIQIFKGILLIFIIKGCASMLGLRAVEYLAYMFVQYGPIAIIIIFQPEIRALLERMGKTNVFSRISTLTLNERERLVEELVKACTEMSKRKTGALISLEQGHSLNDFIKTGTPMNSVVTSELLCSIFVPGTPLHDGAVILQGVKIACAAAYFPPTTQDLPTMYGARHRAAVGISEISDCITIIVSEETGNISIAEGGKLTVVSEKNLREFLTMVVCQTHMEVAKDKIKKESDLEKDIVDLEKEKQLNKQKSAKITHLIKKKIFEDRPTTNKKKTKKSKGNKETKSATQTPMSEAYQQQIIDAKVEKIGIGDLGNESMPLDHLFESIVTDIESEKQEDQLLEPVAILQNAREETQSIPAMRKPVLKTDYFDETRDSSMSNMQVKATLKSTEKTKVRKVVKRAQPTSQDVAEHVIDDIISPEAIVLNYGESSFDDSENEGRK